MKPCEMILSARIQELGAQLQNAKWYKDRGIVVCRDVHNYILRKQKDARLNYWNLLCNNLVMNNVGILVSCPPFKIYNHNDYESNIDLTESDIVEKVSGETISVCWPYYDIGFPMFNNNVTTSMSVENIPLAKTIALMDFDKHFAGGYSMTFKCDKENTTLISARNIRTLKEVSEDELDNIAKDIGASRPYHKFLRCGWNTALDIMKKNEQPFIVRDRRSGERANIFMPIARVTQVIKGNYKHLVPYWLSGTSHQVINQLPHTKEKFLVIEQKVNQAVEDIKKSAKMWQMKNLNKLEMIRQLGEGNDPGWSHRFILMVQTAHEERWAGIIYSGLRKMQSGELIYVLNLRD